MNTTLLRRAVARGRGWRAFPARDGRLLFCAGVWDDERVTGRRSRTRWAFLEIHPLRFPTMLIGQQVDPETIAWWLNTNDR